MDWHFAKEWAGIWGALLSTFLALRSWWETRPLIVVDCVRQQFGQISFRLRITNLSKVPIHVTRVKPWVKGELSYQVINAQVDGWELKDVVRSVMNKRLDVVIPPSAEAVLRFCCDTEPTEPMLLTVHWYKHSAFILPSIPRFIYRSVQELSDLRQHPPLEEWDAEK